MGRSIAIGSAPYGSGIESNSSVEFRRIVVRHESNETALAKPAKPKGNTFVNKTMDEVDQFWANVRARKEKQNARAVKAGKAPKHPELLKPKKSKAAVPPPAESGCEEDTCLSFEEWRAQGWCVKKGAKAARFGMNGDAEFKRKDVRKINPQWGKWKSKK